MINGTKVICLCGSTRFTAEMMMLTWEYAKNGVLALGWFVIPIAEGEPTHHLAEKEGIADLLDELHVVNVGGYYGDSTKREIAYAESQGKPVKYLFK